MPSSGVAEDVERRRAAGCTAASSRGRSAAPGVPATSRGGLGDRSAWNSRRKRSREKRSALRADGGRGRTASRRHVVERRRRTPRPSRSSTSTPVTPSTTVSQAPPAPSATTGVPHACASTGTMPKSSIPGSSTRGAADTARGSPRRSASPGTRTSGPGQRARAAPAPGPCPTIVERHADAPAGLDGDVEALVRAPARTRSGS